MHTYIVHETRLHFKTPITQTCALRRYESLVSNDIPYKKTEGQTFLHLALRNDKLLE